MGETDWCRGEDHLGASVLETADRVPMRVIVAGNRRCPPDAAVPSVRDW